MKFTKLQGAGNDFVLMETSDTGRDWSRLALAMCHRRFGIGSDGLLLLMPSDKADFRMRMFNPDGSEAEVCGNGLRCLVRYILDRGLIKGKKASDLSIETKAGVRKAQVVPEAGRDKEIRVSLGVPRFAPAEIPVSVEKGRGGVILDIKSMMAYTIMVDGHELSLNLVSMGNPHAVCFVSQPVADFPLESLGPRVEHHKVFPQRTNFEVVQVLNNCEIAARVWERGAGETLACGSGAAAIAVASQLRGFVGKKVTIRLPGGTLNVEWDGTGEVWLGGPAEAVFTGEWPDKE